MILSLENFLFGIALSFVSRCLNDELPSCRMNNMTTGRPTGPLAHRPTQPKDTIGPTSNYSNLANYSNLDRLLVP